MWYCNNNFTAFTPTNVGRRFYKFSKSNGYKCDYWKWVDDTLHPRVGNLIHNINKENDNFHREKKALESRMTDLEKCLTSDIEENCERLDKITKSEEAVVDNEEVGVDKSKKKVYKMLIVIATLRCCFAAFITFFVIK
ncbi:hypothetical protein R3W88_029174 [Solanum pinnatisectum]|uniref:Zinc finger GRF-type domain-containing protein n=1 Tax=Solanum pinnatisectum TaxID=50273 RepID=A0AAV9K4U9_9SOLN|nr:hypothetical protein R3W88_029174 [Solanum pinnatisectum]